MTLTAFTMLLALSVVIGLVPQGRSSAHSVTALVSMFAKLSLVWASGSGRVCRTGFCPQGSGQ